MSKRASKRAAAVLAQRRFYFDNLKVNERLGKRRPGSQNPAKAGLATPRSSKRR